MGLVIEPENVVPGWGFGTGIDDFGLISTVATDSHGRVYVLSRIPNGLLHRFDPDGGWLGDWEHRFTAPHGLWIGPDDRVFITDTGEHVVHIFDCDGHLLQTVGTPGVAGAPGEPFNMPTRAVAGPSGAIYVSDGYGQNWVHVFAADGSHLRSWGGDGNGPGQFDTPHAIWVDANELVYVVDRANGRVQVFDSEGSVLNAWDGFSFPHDIYQLADGTFVVTDCATRDDDSRPYYDQMPPAPIILLDSEGHRIGATGASGESAGMFPDCPHSIWVDRFGDVYVSEVVSFNRLQKFRNGIR